MLEAIERIATLAEIDYRETPGAKVFDICGFVPPAALEERLYGRIVIHRSLELSFGCSGLEGRQVPAAEMIRKIGRRESQRLAELQHRDCLSQISGASINGISGRFDETHDSTAALRQPLPAPCGLMGIEADDEVARKRSS
jgi:hypothetical protein